jgi:hypothetical protein
MTSDIVERITEYLSAGGLFNPELMEHDKVRDMVIQCRDEIESLRSRLAEAEYQWKYWMGVADDNGIKSIKARLAEAEALLLDIAEMRVSVLPSRFMDESMAEAARAYLARTP